MLKMSRLILLFVVASLFLLVFATIGIRNSEILQVTESISLTIIERLSPWAVALKVNSFDMDVLVEPSPLLVNSDATVRVTIKRVDKNMSGHVLVGVESESFGIAPSGRRQLALKVGAEAAFIATPKGVGEKKLHVLAKYLAPEGSTTRPDRIVLPELLPRKILISMPQRNYEEIISLTVLEPPTFLWLSKDALSYIQVISALFGIPSLFLFLLTRWIDARNEKAKKDSDIPNIIIRDRRQ